MEDPERRVHDDIDLAGLRGQATAVGLLQLSAELVQAGVLDEAAVTRIKEAIVRDLALSRPRHASKTDFEDALRHRLDSLFGVSMAERG